MAGKLLQKLRVKNPGELVVKAHQCFVKLPYESNAERVIDEVGRLLHGMKLAMFGEDDSNANKENALLIAYEACKNDLLADMVNYIGMIDFESRKEVVQIFGAIVRIDNAGDWPGRDYILAHQQLLLSLFDGYEDAEVALNCGQMLRDCTRLEPIAKAVTNSSIFYELFEKVELASFEVASDAFQTFKDLLTRHKPMVAEFLTANHEEFFLQYNKLLTSENYVTRRQSLKLLGELLLDRANVRTMMRYVGDVGNLVLMMNLLKDRSRSIQFEAFHVFKVFVANPNKSRPVVEVLVNNKDKLLTYLRDFHTDKEDEQFKEERAVIIKEIEMLQLPDA